MPVIENDGQRTDVKASLLHRHSMFSSNDWRLKEKRCDAL
jgi:hypothetical protein